MAENSKPYSMVIDINKKLLPHPKEVSNWDSNNKSWNIPVSELKNITELFKESQVEFETKLKI